MRYLNAALVLALQLTPARASAPDTDVQDWHLPVLRIHSTPVATFIKTGDIYVGLVDGSDFEKTHQVRIGKRRKLEGKEKDELLELLQNSANFAAKADEKVVKANKTESSSTKDDAKLKALETYLNAGKLDDLKTYATEPKVQVTLLWVHGEALLGLNIGHQFFDGRFAWTDGRQGREVVDGFSLVGETAFMQWRKKYPPPPIGSDAEVLGPKAPASH